MTRVRFGAKIEDRCFSPLAISSEPLIAIVALAIGTGVASPNYPMGLARTPSSGSAEPATSRIVLRPCD